MSAKISSATSYSVQLQNEMEGKINYFHYQKFNDPTDASIKKWLNSDNPTEQPAYKTKYRQRPVLSKQSVTLDFPNGGHWYVGEMPDRKRT